MADETVQDLTAILFHRPSLPLDPTDPSCLTNNVTSAFIAAFQRIDNTAIPVEKSTQPLDDATHPHVIVISFRALSTPLTRLRNHPLLLAFENDYHVQVVLQSTSVFRTAPRLAVFDMDSTLIQQEVIDLLAAHAGVEKAVSSITARAMNGELDFSASLRERVALLKGLPETIFEELMPAITLTPGADTLLVVLKKLGVKTALLSGGFVPLAKWVAGKLGIDHIHANELAVDGMGRLTGGLKEGCIVVDGARKRDLLLSIAEDEGIADLDSIMAVGDGANDLPMLWQAGLGVAVNAKPRVQTAAPCRLNGDMALLDVLYLAGLTEAKIDELAGN